MAVSAHNPLLITIDVTQAGGAVSATLTRALRVADTTAYCTVAAGGILAGVTVSGPSAAITNLIALGTNTLGAVGRAASIDSDYSDLMAGDIVQATQSGTGTSSRVTISCLNY